MDKELNEIINILKKVFPRLLENPKMMSGYDVSSKEVNEIKDYEILSLEVLEHLAGDNFFEICFEEVGITEKEAKKVASFLKISAPHFFEELNKEFPYIAR